VHGSGSDVFVVGIGGATMKWTGAAFTALTTGPFESLYGVFAFSTSDVWAAGARGTVLHFDGTTWTQFNIGTTNDVGALWGSAPNNVWLAGDGVLKRWNGTTWTNQPAPPRMIFDLHGLSANDIWAAGVDGLMMHFNGTSWSVVNTGMSTTDDYNTVWAFAANDVWALGDNALAGHWDGSTWTVVTIPTTNHIYAMSGDSNTLVGVGPNATIIKYASGTWTDISTGSTDYYGVAITSPTELYVVGSGVSMLYDGAAAPQYLDLPNYYTLFNIAALPGQPSGTVLFSVGQSGEVLRHN
jgi:hypothetical protein